MHFLCYSAPSPLQHVWRFEQQRWSAQKGDFVSAFISYRCARWVAQIFLVSILCLAVPAAADTAYVDGAGVCNGLVPCFTTIQAAVVGTAAPAEILVFPGTYMETVDLAQMNGGTKGDISLTTVDGTGSPTPGTASIEPPMLAAILHDMAEATPFTGDIVIDGFIVLSVNDDGIELEQVDGDITIRNVVATGNGSDGLDLEIVTPGRVLTITDTMASMNPDDGFHIEMRSEGGEVRLTRVTTEENDSDGVEVNADDPMFFDVLLAIVDLTSTDNGVDGLDVDTGGSVEISDSELSLNGDDGMDITVTGDVEIVDTGTFLNATDFFLGTGAFLNVGGKIVLRRLLSESQDIDVWVLGFDVDDPPDLFVMTQSTIGSALDGTLLLELAPGAAHVLRCNRFSFFEGAGLVLDVDAFVDAELNWWASSTGPTHPNNPGGAGTEIVDGDNGGMGTLDFDPFLTADPDLEPTACGVAPTLEATKSDAVVIDDGDGVTGPGDVVEYTVTITHSGVLEAEDVVFTDPVPADTTLAMASVTTTQGTVVSGNDPADGTVEVDVGTIFPGGMVTITFRVAIDDPIAAGIDQISNQGTVSATGLVDEPTDDPDTPDDDDPTVTPIVALAQLEVGKTDVLLLDDDGDGQVDPGDTVRYTIGITNVGNQEATGVVLTDTPDPNTMLVVGSVTTTQGTVTTGNGMGDMDVEVAIGALSGGGGSATVQFEVLVLDTFVSLPAVVFNQAVATGDGLAMTSSDDPDTLDPDDPTATPVAAPQVLPSIPTLGETALVILALLLALGGVTVLRR